MKAPKEEMTFPENKPAYSETKRGYYSEIVFIDLVISILTLGAVLVLGGAMLKAMDKTLSIHLPPDQVYEVFHEETPEMKLTDEEVVAMKAMMEQQKLMHHSLVMADTALIEVDDSVTMLTLNGAKDKSIRLPFAADGMMEMMNVETGIQELDYPVSAHLLFDNADGVQQMAALTLLSQVESEDSESEVVQYLVELEGPLEGTFENVTLLMKSTRGGEAMEEGETK